MSPQSEDRLPEPARASAPVPPTARILPFEPRQQSDLQRAIQQRAQEAINRDLDMDREQRKPKPLKWITIFAIATIPVILTLGAVDGFLRAFHGFMQVYSTQPPPSQEQAQQAQPEVVQSSEPGVVLLQPVAPVEESSKPGASPEEQKQSEQRSSTPQAQIDPSEPTKKN